MSVLLNGFTEVGLPIILAVVGLIVGGLIVFFIPFSKKLRDETKGNKILREAEIKAEHTVKNAQLDAKQLVNEMKLEADKEIKEKKADLSAQENKLLQREQNIDRRDGALTQKEAAIDEKNELLNRRLADVEKKEHQLQEKIDSIIVELEKVANMSTQEAKDELFHRVESKISKEIAVYIKNKEEEAREQAATQAQELLSLAMCKYAQETTQDRTVSVVALPNDEMKGRIIGREGRNIRSLEALLGVDLIIDDTPEVITISCFNPVRREIARMSLEALIKDGRIQPGRIEEIVEKCKAEVDETIHKTGQEVAFKLGLPRINKELLDYVGRLKYRTSYGQNALDHSIEVAYLAGTMAAELGLAISSRTSRSSCSSRSRPRMPTVASAMPASTSTLLLLRSSRSSCPQSPWSYSSFWRWSR